MDKKRPLKVYLIGDPGPGYEVKLSKQLHNYMFVRDDTKLTREDVVGTDYTGIKFIDVDCQKQYDDFLNRDDINGLVLLYDELFSASQTEELLKQQGNPTDYNAIHGYWQSLQTQYLVKLSAKLRPLIEKKIIYCITWSDMNFEHAEEIFDTLKEGLKDDAYLHRQGLSMYGGKEFNTVCHNVRRYIKPLILKILNGELELQSLQELQNQQKPQAPEGPDL